MKNKIIIISLFLIVFLGNVFSKDTEYNQLSNIKDNETYQATNVSPEVSQILAISFEKNLHRYPCVLPSIK